MNIGNIHFWRDGWLIRSTNRKTHDQPLELGVSKWWKLPGVRVYEDEAECGGTQVRLSAELLWFYVNALLFKTGRETRRWDESGRSWGFYFMGRIALVVRWGRKYFNFDLPFLSLVFVKHEILSLNRNRVVYLHKGGFEDYSHIDELKKENSASFPYRYELLNGEAQNVTALVTVERWTHRWKWTPFRRVRDSIWVQFTEEVGPARGSWKGGCTGCGYDLRPGETVPQCLRRMERDRRFER